jgi:hypothetical protein
MIIYSHRSQNSKDCTFHPANSFIDFIDFDFLMIKFEIEKLGSKYG